ncbi:EIN3-binding F-box protein 1 [Selaginella moellendorffii]|uniref:EIN3-binding F-box protein 1 n=1 Tax=Selaginella moellendorffii TaxID=88036 RepID=UPI000D1CE99E|nr:EIN3-binding F-box protein 1 [Selaginella moellendorffii]|eukprot:XP_024515660.1 EIN3-binding F-box protein 1 [Selaginella moellendorffii]
MAIREASESRASILSSRHHEILVRLMVRLSEQYLRSQRKREEVSAEASDCQVAEWTGDDAYFLRDRESGSHWKRTKSNHSCKRPRIDEEVGSSCSSMDGIPDEILVVIFGSILSARDRSSCASVCRRWLMLLTHMPRQELPREVCSEDSDDAVNQPCRAGSAPQEEVWTLEKQPHWALGDLSRCLEGKKATDVRLAAIAVGTGAHGGLGKLVIRGGPGERSAKGVTDIGLTTIGICCNALRGLTLWDCPNVGDSSLESIARGCRLLQSLDLLKCPNVSDAGLEAVSRGCLRLSNLSIESCDGIGNAGIKAIAKSCCYLQTLSLSRCSNINSHAITSVSKHCVALKKLKLEKIGINDRGLAFLTHHCKSLTKLVFSGLDVTQEGFISLALPDGLKYLKVIVLNACHGVTDQFLSSLGKSCSYLNRLLLIDCDNITDQGLCAFVDGCQRLRGLHIEKCRSITYAGLASVLTTTAETLKSLQVCKCSGIQDSSLTASASFKCSGLKSLVVNHSEGIGNRCLEMAGFVFPAVQHLDLCGISKLSDTGLLAFLETSGSSLVFLNLSDCVELTDKAIVGVSRKCFELQTVILDGCVKVSDKSVGVLASQCRSLQELDVSNCSITDDGIVAVVISVGPTLKTLSLSGCSRVTDESLPTIQKMCDSLTALNLKNCSGFTAAALEKFESDLGTRCDILMP